MKKYLAALPVCIVLAACGGGGSGSTGGSQPMTEAPSQPTSGVDSFVLSVLNLVYTGDDTTEPVSPASYSNTTSEDAEPVPISSS